MGSWMRRNQLKTEKDDEYKDLLVFGYSSRIFQNDQQSDYIAEEQHMVPCLGDASNKVDRPTNPYDCRLLLTTLDNIHSKDDEEEQCPTEAMEEDMCEEERYLDMYQDIKREKDREEDEKRRQSKKSSIGFDYGTPTASGFDADSDSEDEPFEAPEGIKFPVGLELPPNMKLHHIIERTASFVVANGAQMEIVIKAKQRNNAEQFGFLEFDNSLYPFYKYLQKLIREKKYVPNLAKKAEEKPVKKVVSSSLAAIAEAHGSESDEDSDGDFELHPSLFAASNKKVVTPEKKGLIGPRSKPIVIEKPPVFETRPTGDISERTDVYASLFKNLAHVTRQSEGVQEIKMGEEKETPKPLPVVPKPIVNIGFTDPEGRVEDQEYRDWYQQFYHRPCPWIGPRPMFPPTPDLEPIVNSYAEIVAKRGVEFEESLSNRPDLQLHFMDPKSPYFSYYHHKIRVHQWKLTQELKSHTPSPFLIDLSVPPPSPGVVSSPGPPPPDPPSLNRRQRRRLLENREFVDTIEQPGIIDPIGANMVKSASTPAILEHSKPISFSIAPGCSKTEEPTKLDTGSFRFDPDLDDIIDPTVEQVKNDSKLTGLEPPIPPAIPNNTQLDRKEKARIFMEKLLLEKKQRKAEEDEQRAKVEEETIRKAERISQEIGKTRKEEKEVVVVERPRISDIDQMINSKISSLLSESGFKEEVKIQEEIEEEERQKKRKHKRRSRSRSPSADRKKSRRRDRSRHRSRSRDRRRSRSRNRSYRR